MRTQNTHHTQVQHRCRAQTRELKYRQSRTDALLREGFRFENRSHRGPQNHHACRLLSSRGSWAACGRPLSLLQGKAGRKQEREVQQRGTEGKREQKSEFTSAFTSALFSVRSLPCPLTGAANVETGPYRLASLVAAAAAGIPTDAVDN